MNRDPLDRIKWEILTEHEETGSVDVPKWVSRHPEFRNEILDFAFWASVPPRPPEAPASRWEDHGGVAEDSLQRALAAYGLAGRRSPDEDLRHSVIEVRQRPATASRGRAPLSFRRAAVFAWVVHEAGSGGERVSRLRTHKLTYLLEHSLALGLFQGHKKKAAGPYDHTLRYKDAEPIGKKQGWFEVQGTHFLPNTDDTSVYKYAPRYVKDEDVARRLVRHLALHTDAELETLATVHSVCLSLSRSTRTPIGPDEVVTALKGIEAWKAKLRKRHFAVDAIADAIRSLVAIGVLSVEVAGFSDDP